MIAEVIASAFASGFSWGGEAGGMNTYCAPPAGSRPVALAGAAQSLGPVDHGKSDNLKDTQGQSLAANKVPVWPAPFARICVLNGVGPAPRETTRGCICLWNAPRRPGRALCARRTACPRLGFQRHDDGRYGSPGGDDKIGKAAVLAPLNREATGKRAAQFVVCIMLSVGAFPRPTPRPNPLPAD